MARHTSDRASIDYVVVGILRKGDQLVMVQQINPHTEQSVWVLPGGLVESGELVRDALMRELYEEAGVQVIDIGPLASVTQIDRPEHATQTLAFVFEIAVWNGALHIADPDNEVLAVELVPLDEAIVRLAQNNAWLGMQEPPLAYLRGEIGAGAMWTYRETNGQQTRISVIAP